MSLSAAAGSAWSSLPPPTKPFECNRLGNSAEPFKPQIRVRFDGGNYNGIRQSMSAAGNCYDNAVAESFFAILKKELVHRCVFATRSEAYDASADYIENFYNAKRRHSAIGYATPVEHEQLKRAPIAA